MCGVCDVCGVHMCDMCIVCTSVWSVYSVYVVCVYACMVVCVCVCSLGSYALDTNHFIFDFGQDLSLVWDLLSRLGWLASNPQRLACFCLASTGITSTLNHTQIFFFKCGFWGSNSDPRACKTSALLMEPSPQSDFYAYHNLKTTMVIC